MPHRTKQRVTLTLTEYAVLGMLGSLPGREFSGYDLKKLADDGIGYVWRPSKTQLYVVLGHLAAAGLVDRRTLAQETRPDKRLYAITDAGRTAVREWLARDDTPNDPDESQFVLKLYFGEQGDREALIRQLEAYRESFAERLAFYEQRYADGAAHMDLSRHLPAMTLRYGIARARAAVEWADETLVELKR